MTQLCNFHNNKLNRMEITAKEKLFFGQFGFWSKVCRLGFWCFIARKPFPLGQFCIYRWRELPAYYNFGKYELSGGCIVEMREPFTLPRIHLCHIWQKSHVIPIPPILMLELVISLCCTQIWYIWYKTPIGCIMKPFKFPQYWCT